MPDQPRVSHDDLRELAMRILKRSEWQGFKKPKRVGFSCSIVLSELVSAATDIPDAIGWSYGHSVLIECKTSRSDFIADFKKPHRLAGTGAGEIRFFLTPPGIAKPSELGDWGLIETDGKLAEIIVDAPKRTIDLAGHLSEKRMLISTIRRIRTREFLMISREDFSEQPEEPICQTNQ